MSSNQDRPSSRRPTTGRPTTANRPTTARPTTRAAASTRPITRGQGANEQQQYTHNEWNEEDEEEEYDSEDDGDVFAFVPPEIGPASVLQQNPTDPNVEFVNQHPSDRPDSVDNDTYYFDEATGTVYDSKGRLVEMPSDFDPTSLLSDSQPSASAATQDGQPLSHNPQNPRITVRHSAASADFTSTSLSKPRESTDNRSYDSISTFSRDYSGPFISHAKSFGVFPSMDALPEVASVPPSRGSPLPSPLADIPRSLSFDQQIPAHLNMVRRSSHDSDLKYIIDSGDYGFDDSKDKLQTFHLDGGLEQKDGLFHPVLTGSPADSRGVRMVELEMEMEEDSPYPEVRASVSNIDDPDMPINTLRMWFISLTLTAVCAGGNMIFSLRYPAPNISPTVVLLISYPFGKLLAAIMPIRTFTAPKCIGGFQWSLNPGVYNIKEHTLTTIMASVAINQAYALNVVIVQDSDLYYGEKRSNVFAILFVASTQIVGFGLAGICRRFLVWPASMIWPQNLVSATMLNTLHAEEDGADATITRFRFFIVVSIGAFTWYFVPAYLFTGLSSFNWVCWIWPNNFPVNLAFGVTTGLGLSFLTFDWNQIAYMSSPLIIPWWAECNVFFGFVVTLWILGPIMYFKNIWHQSYLPFNSSATFDRFGQLYNISKVITDGHSLDKQAYEDYSPVFISTTLSLVYITGFASLTAVLTHTCLYHGKALIRGLKRIRTEEDDIHAKLMRSYPECPDWWYIAILLFSFAAAVIAIEVYDTGMPIWALVIAILIPAVYILPIGFIFAMTGQALATNLVGEFAAGYILPGKPLANMIFKAFAVQGLLVGLQFVQDLKLGHYMKIPPRLTFMAQLIGVVVAIFVQIGVKDWMFSHVPNLCNFSESHNYTCPFISLFYSASLIWGAIGPDRMFGKGSIYSPLYWSLLVGALIPIPFWLLARKSPRSWIRYVNWPVILTGNQSIPSAAGINVSSWFLVGFVFQYLVRKISFRWWSKYNFVLAAALDSGTIISTFLIFFALIIPKNSHKLNWWGNNVSANTLDGNAGVPWKTPSEGFAGRPTY